MHNSIIVKFSLEYKNNILVRQILYKLLLLFDERKKEIRS